ncbi:MAG: hypothetical protein K9H64_05300 [Bacteroidales bacterium]|nr:hypothetical protein [Bacteroidales bacterium]MCF8455255.1 hypothetical protein [Bacteroidales bacterium]
MKNTYLLFVVSIIILLAVSVTSCKKDILKPNENTNMIPEGENIVPNIGHLKVAGVNGILVFDNADDLLSTIESVNNMDYNDLVDFETSMGYSSWAIICTDYYDMVDTASILNDSTMIFDHVDTYSDYLVLVREADSSYTYETRFIGLPQYEIMNQDRLFIVNDTLYKVYDSGFLLTTMDNYNEILTIGEDELEYYTEEQGYYFVEQDNTYQIDDQLKSVTPIDVGKLLEKRSTNGKKRLYAAFGCMFSSGGGLTRVYKANQCFIPYKKSCGVWFRVKRTITIHNNRIGVDYKIGNVSTWERAAFSLAPITTFRNKYVDGYPYYTYKYHTHMCGYDIWADTPDVSPIDYDANTYLL